VEWSKGGSGGHFPRKAIGQSWCQNHCTIIKLWCLTTQSFSGHEANQHARPLCPKHCVREFAVMGAVEWSGGGSGGQFPNKAIVQSSSLTTAPASKMNFTHSITSGHETSHQAQPLCPQSLSERVLVSWVEWS